MLKMVTRFFTIADFEEEEEWLRKQHQQGLRLDHMTPPCFFYFEECEPADVVYRVEYTNAEANSEYRSMYADFGWEYVGKCTGWHYFRKPYDEAASEEDSELYSDNASRIEMVEKVLKTRLLPLMVIFLCCILPNFNRAIDGALGAFFTVFFSIMAVVYIYLLVHCGLKLKRLKERWGDNN